MKSERYSYSEILDDVTRYFTKIQTNEYLETGLFPIIDQGKEFIAGYTNSSLGIYNDYPIIIFGDHTRIFKYIDFPCYLGADGVKALKNIKPDKINSKYLYYYLKNSYIPDTGYNRHFKWVKELFFNIHDIQTQKEIVAVLDKVTSLISMRKEQLEKLDILVKSKFIEMFGDPVLNPKGWEKKKLEDVCYLNKSTLNNKTDPNYSFKYIDLSSVKEGNIQFPKDKITFQSSPSRARRIIKKNDVIIATVRPNLKGFACINFDVDNIIVSTGFAVLTPIANLHAHYLHHLFYTDFITEQINKVVKGANYPAINSDDMKKFIIPIPPLDLQNQFSDFVEQVEKNKENIKSSLNQLETLYSALMQEYFG